MSSTSLVQTGVLRLSKLVILDPFSRIMTRYSHTFIGLMLLLHQFLRKLSTRIILDNNCQRGASNGTVGEL